MATSSEPRPELRALTGLRGIAATVVALSHFRLSLPYDLQSILWADAAVDLFFCLSGFTLSYVYRRDTFKFGKYLLARVARIYPLYLLTLIIAGPVWLFLDPAKYPAKAMLIDLLLQIPMLNAWPIGTGSHWNFPAWSVSVEWFCYVLIFPLLLSFRAPRSVSMKLACLLALSTASFLMFRAHFDSRIFDVGLYIPASQWSYWVSLTRGVCGFTTGWIAFSSYDSRDALYAFCAKFAPLLWATLFMILALTYCGFVDDPQPIVFLAPFIVLGAADRASLASRILGSSVPHFLGRISYSIYMMHLIVFAVFVGIASANPAPMEHIALVLMLFAVSALTYFKIELPAREAILGLRIKTATGKDIDPGRAIEDRSPMSR